MRREIPRARAAHITELRRRTTTITRNNEKTGIKPRGYFVRHDIESFLVSSMCRDEEATKQRILELALPGYNPKNCNPTPMIMFLHIQCVFGRSQLVAVRRMMMILGTSYHLFPGIHRECFRCAFVTTSSGHWR
jgi:hypothetical protein